jgi:hypothetical protein
MTDTVIRALDASDAHLFDAMSDPLGAAEGHRLTRHRPDWKRVALRDGTVVARGTWWGGPDDTEPIVLNWFDVAEGEEEAGAELLRTAPWQAEIELNLPDGWRTDPGLRATAGTRVTAAHAAGYELLVERYMYRWTPECGLPETPRSPGVRPGAGRRGVLRRAAPHPLRHPGRPCPAGHCRGRTRPGGPGGTRLLPLVPVADRPAGTATDPGLLPVRRLSGARPPRAMARRESATRRFRPGARRPA